MTMDDVELVEFPYPDDWYDKPEMRLEQAVPVDEVPEPTSELDEGEVDALRVQLGIELLEQRRPQ